MKRKGFFKGLPDARGFDVMAPELIFADMKR
jgi:hypothetical protein